MATGTPDTTILGGDVGVWWLSNNRAKFLSWEGTTGTHTMNELYSAMQTLQDESDTIDDGTCFFADTPTEYTIGKIDQGDNDPWYIQFDVMQHITGGSLKTSGWAHADGTNTGVVIVPGTNTGTPMTSDDEGYTVTGATTGSGTLLEIIEGVKGDYLVIRPDSDTGDEFATTSQVITSARGSFTFDQSSLYTENTGDMVWANIYSIGTVDSNVHMYVYQGEFDADTPATPATDNSNRVYSVNSSTIDYWGEGHIDICVPIMRYWRNQPDGNWDAVDSGYLRVFARKGGDLQASFEVSNNTTSGGRNPVPLQTSTDLNQGTGTKTITTGVWTNTPVDGTVITQAGTDARGIVDAANSVTDTSLSYFPIAEVGSGGLLTAMNNSGAISGSGSFSATATGSPADAGPATTAWFTNSAFPILEIGYSFVSGVTNLDIDNDGTDEHYGIVVNCNNNTLAETYEWLKFICSYNQAETHPVEQAFEDSISQVNIYGEEYIGGTAYFGYSGGTGAYATKEEGVGLTQQTSLATGYIIAHDTANDVILLRNTRGTWNDSDTIDADDDSDTFTPDESGGFAASVTSPFGTFAGGTFFGARGVIIENWVTADENKFILTDIEGATAERPTSVVITVSNVHGNAVTETDSDLVAVYLLDGSGGDIDKDLLTCDGSEVVGDGTLDTSNIPDWVPSSGRLLFTDVSANEEYVIAYSAWDGATDQFTLDKITPTLDSGTNTTTVQSTGNELDAVPRGALVVNDSQGAHSYVVSINAGTNSLTISPAITGQSDGDTIYIDAIPDLDGSGTAVSASDTVLPFIIHDYPTGSTSEASVIYPGATMYIRIKVRNSRETDLINGPIKPFSTDDTVTVTDTTKTVQTVRTIDTII